MTESQPQIVPDDPIIGTVVDNKYRVVRLCGRGGMGTVYEAQNVTIGKRVALKFIDPESASCQEAVHRFLREAQAASAVESQHIVQVFDVGELPVGRPYIVMELLRGENLASRLSRMDRLPPADAVLVAVQTLRGLKRAHESGIVHRDLKPENIFLVNGDDDSTIAKVVDFGISKISRRENPEFEAGTLTRKGVVLGTPHYMSPEQAQGMPDLDARTDLWAVGAILFECIAGERPHKGKTYEQVILSICTHDVADVRSIVPSVPPSIAEVIHRALQRDKEQRIPSASAFIELLREAVPEIINPSQPFAADPAKEAVGNAPTVSVQTPARAQSQEAQLNPATRVSWSSSHQGRPVGASEPSLVRQHWRLAVLGSVTMLGAFGITLAAMLTSTTVRREQNRGMVGGAWGDLTQLKSDSVRLIPNAPRAQIHVDDQHCPDGIIRGLVGSSHRIHVAADGFKEVERTIMLDGVEHEVHVDLEPIAEAPAAAPVDRPKASATRAKQSSGEPKPAASGIAPGLKLKMDGP